MKRSILSKTAPAVFIAVAAFASFAGAETFVEGLRLIGGNPDNKFFYKPSEKMTFVIKASDPALVPEDAKITWRRTGDDGKTETGEFPSRTEGVVETSIDSPGFVHVQAWIKDAALQTIVCYSNGVNVQKAEFDGGAGASPDELEQAVPPPADFDAFWAARRAELDAVPLNSEIKELPSPNPAEFRLFQVRTDCAGPRPMTGYMTMPADASPSKRYPARAWFDGYSYNVPAPSTSHLGGWINLHVFAHGYELGRDKAYYDEFGKSARKNGPLYAFDHEENSDPKTAYFMGMTFRVMRAFDFLKSLPEWDGTGLRADGGSQGGLQTMWAASLVPGLTYAEPVVTWCCDLGGITAGRIGGWRPGYQPALDYFDPVNHARHVPAGCYVNISRAGLGDYTCPPSGLAVLYNNLKCRKRIAWFQGSTHGYVPPSPAVQVIEAPAVLQGTTK